MNKYKEYMDGVTASDTLHEKLKNLNTVPKKSPTWKKYGIAAAALVLVLGIGAAGVGMERNRDWNALQESSDPAVAESMGDTVPATEPAPAPMPNSPGMEMMGGYEVSYGEGPDSTVAYYCLPAIKYGEVENQMEADIALPVGVTRRDLTNDELLALLGGETNLIAHLNWGGYEVGAYAMVWPDDSMWLLCVYGSKGDTGLEHFSLEVSPGQLPPTCLVYTESVLNNIWGQEVMADSYDSEIGSSRRVTFMNEGYGYRFAVTGTDREAITYLVSRAVRFIIVDDGLLLNQNRDVPADVPVNEEMTTQSYDPTASETPVPTTEPAEP